MQSETAVFSDWVQKVVEWAPQDGSLPGGLDALNLALNRRRLAEFLEHFWSDSDVQDFLLLDLLAVGVGAEISSTGEIELVPDLSTRPFRLWEYIWLYKALGLAEGGKSVLDLGGPASHVIIAAALARNRIHSVDLNPRIVEAGRQCAMVFQLDEYRAEVGDMRDLSSIAPDSVDRIVCCSVLEHLTGPDQKLALSEMARVLAPGGVIGLTFDYGTPAPGVNIHLPPPHEPPESADEVRRRYVHSGLEILGDLNLENPIPGSLFRTQEVSYTMGTLFLGKPPLEELRLPAPVQRGLSVIPNLRVSDLIIRLQEKARQDLSRAEGAKALHLAAEDRLIALEEAHAELGRLYVELELRDQKLKEEKAALLNSEARGTLQRAADERLIALDETHAELHRLHAELELRAQNLEEEKARSQAMERYWSGTLSGLQQAAQERLDALETAHAEMARLYADLSLREHALLEMQTRNSNHEQENNSLELKIEEFQKALSDSNRELTALRSESILTYFRRRWKQR